MELQQYFDNHQGLGILSTADRQGRVDAAVYARPQFLADGRLALILRERLTYSNLQENSHAVYLFVANAAGYQGVRLYLHKVGEDDNPQLIRQLTRRSLTPEEDAAAGPKHIVYFRLEQALQLIGGEPWAGLEPARSWNPLGSG